MRATVATCARIQCESMVSFSTLNLKVTNANILYYQVVKDQKKDEARKNEQKNVTSTVPTDQSTHMKSKPTICFFSFILNDFCCLLFVRNKRYILSIHCTRMSVSAHQPTIYTCASVFAACDYVRFCCGRNCYIFFSFVSYT